MGRGWLLQAVRPQLGDAVLCRDPAPLAVQGVGAAGSAAQQVSGLNTAHFPAPSCFVPASLLPSLWVIPAPCSFPSHHHAILGVPSPLHRAGPFPLAQEHKEHALGSLQPLVRYMEVR